MATTSITPADFTNGAPPASNLSISDKTVCISIQFGSLGNSRKVSTSEIEVDADKKLLHVSKKLLDSKELRAISKHDSDTRQALLSKALPSMFRSGVYLIPIPAIQQVEVDLQEAKIERAGLIEKFLSVYAGEKSKAEERLKGLYNSHDYPSIEAVRNTFTFEWQYLSFSTPGKLKEISHGFFEQEQQKAAAKWATATDEIRLMLRVKLKDLVDHMTERLAPDDGGGPKRFQKSSVTKITEFLENFKVQNITDDAQLDQIVGHCRAILNGVDAEAIRQDDTMRAYVSKGFSAVKQCLDLLVEDAGTRRIDISEDEV